MSDSAKKKSKDDTWNFEVGEEHLEQVQLKKPKVKASAGNSSDMLKKKGTGTPKKKRSLEIDAGPKKKKMTRAAIARRDAALEQHKDIMHPNLGPRIMATLIDFGLIAGIYFVSLMFLPLLNEQYLILLRENGLNQTLDPVLLNHILSGLVTFIGSLLLVYFPAFMFFKTPGKMMMKIRIGHPVIGERASRFMVFIRELIVKPISVATVLGVLIGIKNDDNRCLHDFICRTALWIDD